MLLLLLSLGLWGQKKPPFRYVRYTTEDGLPHNVGYDLCQDSLGFLYIGTDDGLTRFDGSDFELVERAPGLESPYAITLTTSPAGKIYAGLHRNELGYLVGNQLKPVPGLTLTPHLMNPVPLQLTEDHWLLWDVHPNRRRDYFIRLVRQADRWVSQLYRWRFASDGPVIEAVRYRKNPRIFSLLSVATLTQPASAVNAWGQLSDGRVWVGTDRGLYWYLPDGRVALEPGTAGLSVFSVEEGQAQQLWLGTKGKLYLGAVGQAFQPQWSLPSADPILQLERSGRGWLYFFSEARTELHAYQPSTGEHHELARWMGMNNTLSFIHVDRWGDLWATTNGDGLFYISESLFIEWHSGKADLEGFVLATAQGAHRRTWIASPRQLYWQQGSQGPTREFRLPHPLKDMPYRVKSLDSDGTHVWVATNYGLCIYDLAKGELRHYPPPLTCISGSQAGMPPLIASREYGAAQDYHFSTFQGDSLVTRFTLPAGKGWGDFTCYARTHGPSVRTWLGHTDGLVALDETGWSAYTAEDGLPSAAVNSLCALRDTLWIATERGLAYWTPDTIQMVSTCQLGGRPPRLRQILADKQGRLWMASPRGLICYDRGRICLYSQSDGLPANDINHLQRDSAQQMWISTSAGVALLDLEQALPPELAPTLTWGRIATEERRLPPCQEAQLSLDTRLALNYKAIMFQNPEGLIWRYRLRPDEPWQSYDGQVLHLTNLREGRYQVAVIGRRINSGWSDPLIFNFEILLPWYRQPWFYVVGSALLIGTLIMLIGRARQRRAASRTRRMEVERHMADLELKGLQAQMNPHFIFNSLNAIQHFVLTQDVLAANEYLSRFARLIRRFLEASRKRYHSLEEEVTLLQEYIEMEALCYEGSFGYEVEVAPDLDLSAVQLPAMLIQPLVENAIRHGLLPAGRRGRLFLQFREEGNQVVCVVEDNGVGRQAEVEAFRPEQHQSHGLALVYDRIATFNRAGMGNISLEIRDLTHRDGSPRGTRALLYF